MSIRYGIFIVISSLILSGCEKMSDYYLGIYQQPELTVEGLPEGLNVFCVLRPDNLYGINRSFAMVQQVWPALGYENFSIINNVDIQIEQFSGDAIADEVKFSLQPPDSVFYDSLYRADQYFEPQAGESYRMVCNHPDFPPAVGICKVPNKPVLQPESLQYSSNNLEFVLQADTTTQLIDVYLVGGLQYGLLTRVVPDGGNVHLQMEAPVALQPGMRIHVYFFDANMAGYYANSNTSLNFNKYRVGFSTLESGYGVFGALNVLEIEL